MRGSDRDPGFIFQRKQLSCTPWQSHLLWHIRVQELFDEKLWGHEVPSKCWICFGTGSLSSHWSNHALAFSPEHGASQRPLTAGLPNRVHSHLGLSPSLETTDIALWCCAAYTKFYIYITYSETITWYKLHNFDLSITVGNQTDVEEMQALTLAILATPV